MAKDWLQNVTIAKPHGILSTILGILLFFGIMYAVLSVIERNQASAPDPRSEICAYPYDC
jgi:hypothetical protein